MTGLNRRIKKSLVYRLYSIFITLIMVFVVTGELLTTTLLTITIELFKLINYYLFDLLWDRNKKTIKEVKT